ncbi:hypothetical protein AYI70_g5464, partial [Smittium culicis]
MFWSCSICGMLVREQLRT